MKFGKNLSLDIKMKNIKSVWKSFAWEIRSLKAKLVCTNEIQDTLIVSKPYFCLFKISYNGIYQCYKWRKLHSVSWTVITEYIRNILIIFCDLQYILMFRGKLVQYSGWVFFRKCFGYDQFDSTHDFWVFEV